MLHCTLVIIINYTLLRSCHCNNLVVRGFAGGCHVANPSTAMNNKDVAVMIFMLQCTYYWKVVMLTTLLSLAPLEVAMLMTLTWPGMTNCCSDDLSAAMVILLKGCHGDNFVIHGCAGKLLLGWSLGFSASLKPLSTMMHWGSCDALTASWCISVIHLHFSLWFITCYLLA